MDKKKEPGGIRKAFQWIATEIKIGNLKYVSAAIGVVLAVLIMLSVLIISIWSNIYRIYNPIPVEVSSHEIRILSETLDHLRIEQTRALRASRDSTNAGIREQQLKVAEGLREQIDEIIRILSNSDEDLVEER